jgi:hypothetical protein
MCPEDGGLQCLVVEVSSQRMYRELFWQLARIGPLALFALGVCLALPRQRRIAAAALLASAAGAIAFTIVFHYTYAITAWGGHDSAIRYLDEVAMWSGFAASAIGCVGCWIIYRRVRGWVGAGQG